NCDLESQGLSERLFAHPAAPDEASLVKVEIGRIFEVMLRANFAQVAEFGFGRILAQTPSVECPIGFDPSCKAAGRIGINADRVYTPFEAFDQCGSTAAERVEHPITFLNLETINELTYQVIRIA